MSYKFDTSRNSPNFTPGAESARTFGRGRTIEAIAIHWWGDPNQNPSYEGIVNHLCNPNAGVSAHFVASGSQGRRVAQIVNFNDVSWATNSANPYTISIECDPRCSDEDYDTVAELIAQIRDAYGNLPLVPHRQFVATACPGNYDLGRLDALARTKDGSGDWGDVKNINQAPPTPAPTPDAPKPLHRLIVGGKQVAAYSSEQNAYNGYVQYGSNGTIQFNGVDVTAALVNKYAPVIVPPVDIPTVPETPPKAPESPPKASLDESSTTLLQDVKKLLQELLQLLKSIFNR